jgi:uncharacterized protein HemX
VVFISVGRCIFESAGECREQPILVGPDAPPESTESESSVMRAHLLRYSAAPVALLSVVVFVLAAGASVAQAAGTTVTRGMERGSPGLTGGGTGTFSLILVLVLAAVAVAAVAFAVVNDRRRTVTRSASEIAELPGARRDDTDESARKAA